MKVENISPKVYGIAYFKKLENAPKLSFEKTQYSYRFIIVMEGKIDVFLQGKTHNLVAGDVVYLLPGEPYRLLTKDADFSLLSIYFGYVDNDVKDSNLETCVFLNDFKSELLLPLITFENASILNKSGVFKNVHLKDIQNILSLDKTSELYSFYARYYTVNIIAEILKGLENQEFTSSPAKQIVKYIKTNPQNDLSGEELNKKFSYHKNYINKLVKLQTGKTLNEYVRFVKLEYAKMLLFEMDYSLSEIAEKLGFYDYSHFYKAFISETKTTPKKYKKGTPKY